MRRGRTSYHQTLFFSETKCSLKGGGKSNRGRPEQLAGIGDGTFFFFDVAGAERERQQDNRTRCIRVAVSVTPLT